jgi:hypothetical protein
MRCRSPSNSQPCRPPNLSGDLAERYPIHYCRRLETFVQGCPMARRVQAHHLSRGFSPLTLRHARWRVRLRTKLTLTATAIGQLRLASYRPAPHATRSRRHRPLPWASRVPHGEPLTIQRHLSTMRQNDGAVDRAEGGPQTLDPLNWPGNAGGGERQSPLPPRRRCFCRLTARNHLR